MLVAAGASVAAASAHTYYVSHKRGKNTNPCTKAAPCATIQHAVHKAHKGDTVKVERGTYRQHVRIVKDITLIGIGRPIVNVAGLNSTGFTIRGARAAGATISGFIIERATFEGILVKNTSGITISNNIVRGNDKGLNATPPTGECAPFGGGPGDCGEAIHLIHVSGATITGNKIHGNAGGVLLTDETGPTHGNLVANNTILNNRLDCGVTLAGHNPTAVSSKGKTAGVYDNTIRNNTVNGNGTEGEGAGILMAGAAPGTGVYDNLVEFNTANGNGLAGVTLHSHAPGQNLNGNKIENNTLSDNGVADTSEAEFGENDGKTSVTVDVLVGSDVSKLKGIVIRGNTLSNAHYGVYTKNDPTKVNKKQNTFNNVAVPVKQV
jgi:parallel beta-helix repeat protein